jgi:anti-sigma regulatory factor (Ser/Thr protein kinase)
MTAHGDEVTERVDQVFVQRDDQAPRAARRLVDQFDDLDTDLRSNLVIVVSELVANAVRHSRRVENGQVRLLIEVGAGRVHVEVHDPGRGFDPTPAANDLGGLGLTIVGKIAGTWGIENDPNTIVWCDLPR